MLAEPYDAAPAQQGLVRLILKSSAFECKACGNNRDGQLGNIKKLHNRNNYAAISKIMQPKASKGRESELDKLLTIEFFSFFSNLGAAFTVQKKRLQINIAALPQQASQAHTQA